MFESPDLLVLPSYHPEVFSTSGTAIPYLKEAGVVMLAAPNFAIRGIEPFLRGFDMELGFDDYLNDPTELEDGVGLAKFLGQLCYLSFGEKRSMNSAAEKYILNILRQGHGSVLEHANYSFLFYGVSRSFTHELVRHRAGFAYSQVSQRYVDGAKLRFVKRPEYEGHEELTEMFETWIDDAAMQYESRANVLEEGLSAMLAKFDAAGISLDMHGYSATDLRKQVNQAARSCLPNETEAPIGVTGNVRAWRHFFNMRGSLFAEPEARAVALRCYELLSAYSPIFFSDCSIETHPYKGRYIRMENPKV